MFRETESLLLDALQLPDEERLRVAERLFESLREEKVLSAWLDEAERRKSPWDAGLLNGVDGADVIRGLRNHSGR